MTHPLGQRIADVMELARDSAAIEYDGRWWTWGAVGDQASRIAALVEEHGGTHAQVGVLLRNTPAHVATFLGVLLADATLVVINPARGDDRTRADIAALSLPIIVGAADDVTTLVEPSAATTLLVISDLTKPPTSTPAATSAPSDQRPGLRSGC